MTLRKFDMVRSSLPKKIKLKIENNVKKVKKVLQNGYKYPQNSSTLLFSIDLNLKFPKIVKNYYGAPPPPGLSKLVFRPFVFTNAYCEICQHLFLLTSN